MNRRIFNLFFLFFGPLSVLTAAQNRDALIAEIESPPAAAIPTCASPAYRPPSDDDVIQEAWGKRKKFRLVIGAGKYKLTPDKDRNFIAPTAAFVDSKLEKLGYKALPSLQQSPLIVDAAATKPNIVAALQEMAQQVGKDGIGIVYYAGHGLITPNHVDLTLGVYDEAVLPTDGLTVSNIIGLLGVDSTYVQSVDDIPNIFLVIEACDSGQSSIGDNSVVVTDGDIQIVQRLESAIIPPARVAILTATTHGGNHDAYPLGTMNVSAFGYYFGRALDEDWACANAPTRDGILVNSEMQEYLLQRLESAYTNQLIGGEMKPTTLPKDDFAIWSYRADRQADCGGIPCIGNRNRFVRLFVSTGPNQVAHVTLPNGFRTTCGTGQRCSLIVSSRLSGLLSVKTQTISGTVFSLPHPPIISTESTQFEELLRNGSSRLAGVNLQIKKEGQNENSR